MQGVFSKDVEISDRNAFLGLLPSNGLIPELRNICTSLQMTAVI